MLGVAVLIGAVGVLTDSPVLIVGAMVVGPDYGPIAGVTLNLHRHRLDRCIDALTTMLIGFGTSILLAAALAAVVRAIGAVPDGYVDGVRPLTSFVARPDGWSVVVAVLAGIAGTLALTEAKAGALVGVLISVTTVPAAANLGVAVALGRFGEGAGAAVQLSLNVVVMVVTGVAVLRVQQWASRSPIR